MKAVRVLSLWLFLVLSPQSSADAYVLAPHLQQHEALYIHCVNDWSTETVGEVFCAWALENGYPVYGADTERSCPKAYALGIDYFRFLSQERGLASTVNCALFIEFGPSTLVGW